MESRVMQLWSLAGVLLCAALNRASYPSCVLSPPEPAANTMECWTWSYDRVADNCTFFDPSLVNLFEGSLELGVDYINQPGYWQGIHSNNKVCTWRIEPVDSCHTTAFMILDKDFHQTGSHFGKDCDLKDHLEVVHKTNAAQNAEYCGSNADNDCPTNNCLSFGFLYADNVTTVAFRSDDQNTARGFLGIVVNNIISSCPAKRRAVPMKKMRVPRTKPLCLASRRRGVLLPCECYGNCTLERPQRHDSETTVRIQAQNQKVFETIRAMVLQPPAVAEETAMKFVNSEDDILRGAARRVLGNIKHFEATVPTFTQKLQYRWQRLDNYNQLQDIITRNPELCLSGSKYLTYYEYNYNRQSTPELQLRSS